MGNFFKKIILAALLVVLPLAAVPRPAQARNLFRQFFRDLGRASRFVVSLPNRSTRWMGPVLGPIAASVLTQNISAHHHLGRIFNHARRINNTLGNIEEQRRLTGEVRRMYRNQASDLRDYVKELNQARDELRNQLASHDIDMHTYIESAINLDRMIDTVNQTADRFDAQADHLRTADIIKMASGQLAQNVLGEIKNAALSELRSEVDSLLNPYIIRILTDRNSGGLDTLIDIALYGLPEDNHKFDSDEFRQRVKDRIRQVLAENRENLDRNFADLVRHIVAEMEDEAAGDKEVIGEQAEEAIEAANDNKAEKQNPYSADELAESLADIPRDKHGCLPGYVWRRMSGVGCVQKDCREVGAHYSYTQVCICSSVNPKPGAKTKACQRPSNYRACPSCVYACVGPNEECPVR